MLCSLLLCLMVVAPVDETFDSLAAEHDERVAAWVDALMAARRDSADDPKAPIPEFLPRFAALAEDGDGRAMLWLARHLGHADDGAAGELIEQVARAGPSPWTADTLYELSDDVSGDDRARVLELLDVALAHEGLADAQRVRLLVTKGNLLGGEAGTPMYFAAIEALAGVDTVPTEDESPAALDDVARRVIEATNDAHTEHWEASFGATESDVYFQKACATPAPKLVHGPLFDVLADRGATPARLRVLSNISDPATAPRDELRAHLRGLSGARMSEREFTYLGYEVPWIAQVLGVAIVADEMQRLIDEGPESGRSTAMTGLGVALSNESDDELRARGLALLEEVIARWPDSDDARRAEGKQRRFTELLVGEVAPDVVTEDVDGEPLALSDYRGKVTVLKFYGFW